MFRVKAIDCCGNDWTFAPPSFTSRKVTQDFIDDHLLLPAWKDIRVERIIPKPEVNQAEVDEEVCAL